VSSSPIIVLFHPNRMTMPRDLLDGGADDCVEEPFLVQELAARARRLLVRAGVWLHKRIVLTPAGSLEVDPLARTARLGDRRLDLTGLEFKLLVVLLGAGGSPVSHDELLRRMWGEHRGSTQNLRRVIATLRDTIEQDPKQPALLISVRGIGYRLNVSEDPSAASDNSLET
jgi:two-component system OmpR family response regulator